MNLVSSRLCSFICSLEALNNNFFYNRISLRYQFSYSSDKAVVFLEKLDSIRMKEVRLTAEQFCLCFECEND